MTPFDPATEALSGKPGDFATLFDLSLRGGNLWRSDELASILRHQLSAPIRVDLGGFSSAMALRLKKLRENQASLPESFSELFRHPKPPLELLVLTKDFSKANVDHPESTIPGEVAKILYYLSISLARVRLGSRISKLTDRELQRGLIWARKQTWIDRGTRILLENALSALSPRIEGNRTQR